MPDSNNKEAIEVLEVASTPSKQSAELSVHSSAPVSAKKWLWIGFIVLLILAGYVIFLLPSALDESMLGSSTGKSAQSTIKSKKEPIDTSELPVGTTQSEQSGSAIAQKNYLRR